MKIYMEFEVASYKVDLYHLFFERLIHLLKTDGILGFITPNTYLTNLYIEPLRKFILDKSSIYKLIRHDESVFPDASVDTATIILRLNHETNLAEINRTLDHQVVFSHQINTQDWRTNTNLIFNTSSEKMLELKGTIPLSDCFESYFGIQAYDKKTSTSEIKTSNHYKPIVNGKDFNKNTQAIHEYWYDYQPQTIKSGGDWNVCNQPRVLIRQIGSVPIAGYCEEGILASNTIYNLYPKKHIDQKSVLQLMTIINSKLIAYLWKTNYSDEKKTFPKIKGYQLKSLPLPKSFGSNDSNLTDLSKKVLRLNNSLLRLVGDLASYIKAVLKGETSSKLQSWHELTFADFLKELTKAIKATNKVRIKEGHSPIPELTKKDEFEWMELFEPKKQEAQKLQAQIKATEKEIDQMVYELYGLSEEEILIVEGS
ncbi:hypothetical protein F0365_07130 [Nonlabens sp. Ci31]|nr:TaqI-like C-terminal specificity domain-containing protein [Nonlabens sp. Ci31]QJP34195.1 hypothetical protein F0365_07130 [Nonlabens sp. Ci31]